MNPTVLYYLSAIPISVGVWMAYKAGRIEQSRDRRPADLRRVAEAWNTAVNERNDRA